MIIVSFSGEFYLMYFAHYMLSMVNPVNVRCSLGNMLTNEKVSVWPMPHDSQFMKKELGA